MSRPAIRVEGLSKRYYIGVRERGRRWWGRALADVAAAPIRRLRGFGRSSYRQEDTIWALKDVSFQVQPGEVLGVIGANGAGKSTLLKILSRITCPTEGYAELNGRVGSLLEVGTGFHQELSGRENIYLSGALLGMSKREINARFDEIVEFSGVEKFIDTPVKRYSSGMVVRLGFAVAAHLEPEILLIDEVLAVGDAAFQKKCLGKMQGVARQGRTVLFVSHNIQAVRNLCKWTIWLQGGRIAQAGDTAAVTEAYLRQSLRAETLDDIEACIRALPPDPAFRLEAVQVSQNGRPTITVLNGEPVELEIRYTVHQRTSGLRVYFDLYDDEECLLIRSFHDDDVDEVRPVEPGEYVSTGTIPECLLAPRAYELRIHGTIFNVRSCTADGLGIPLNVSASSGINRAYPQDPIRSKMQPRIFWRTEMSAGSQTRGDEG